MPERTGVPGRWRGWGVLAGVVVLLAALRGGVLLHDHSLNSIDGALQTWFAADHFARGEPLGTAFQSYLGITMVLALLPLFIAGGKTLFASTLAAHTLVLAGAFATACACVWLIRPIPPRARWQAALVLAFLFYYAGAMAGAVTGMAWPATLDPGVSLRPLRGALAFFVLPFFVVLARRVLREGRAPGGGFALGLVAGAGLLWSNDAGIPLVIALTGALALALWRRPVLLLRTLAASAAGIVASAGAILLAVTHGAPGPWLTYNFRDVAGDQFWFFAPWERSTRILSVADLPNILLHADPLAAASLVVLTACVLWATLQRLRDRSAPVRGSAFVFVGASVLGTALLPQIGGHVGAEYNGITFVLGACAPLIVAPASLWRRASRLLRAIGPRPTALLTGFAVLAMIGAESARLAASTGSERTVLDPALGFRVTPEYAADLKAMRRLAAVWDKAGVPANRRLLSVYTSPLDIVAGVQSPADVGSLIHALGPDKRAAFTALAAKREVAAVTTIAPDYSGWEGWLTRASWPFFRALRENYSPIARNDQQVLWVRSEGKPAALAPATCRVVERASGRLVLEIAAGEPGLASVSVSRQPPFATSRGAMLTVVEDSPETRSSAPDRWADFPRYGVANVAALELMAPVAPGQTTRLRLETLDGSAIGRAHCAAVVHPSIDLAALPPLPQGIDAYLARGAQ